LIFTSASVQSCIKYFTYVPRRKKQNKWNRVAEVVRVLMDINHLPKARMKSDHANAKKMAFGSFRTLRE